MVRRTRAGVAAILMFLATGILTVCLLRSLHGGEPKTVYVAVRGVAPGDSVHFLCYLVRGGRKSETQTGEDVGFDYLSTPDGKVHHLSIQCGNFKVMSWSPGDLLVVRVEGRRPLAFRLDEQGEQTGPSIPPAGRRKGRRTR